MVQKSCGNMRRIIKLIAAICLLSFVAKSQTADITTGCVPLVVAFDAPNAGAYYWDFDDGATAIIQSPDHTFTEPGQFDVVLRESQNGSIIGTISITVYADPILEIDPSVVSGCSPLTVDFTSFITLDPALSIQDVTWSFGDGSSSSATNPTHTYTNSGTFSVSLQLTTNESECDKTEIFADLIMVESIGNVNFSLNFDGACEAPTTVQITNNSTNSADLTYEWDLGNGTTASGYNPGSVTYNQDGIYDIVLSVSNNLGCTETSTESFTIGLPSFDFSIPDTVCLETFVPIMNETATSFFFWQFGPNANITTSALRNPFVEFNTPGLQTIQLQAFNDVSCPIDTTFQIFVEQIDPSFTISPEGSCVDPQTITLTANEQSYDIYSWNEVIGSAQQNLEIVCPLRDSLHINLPDTTWIDLIVTSFAGCVDSLRQPFVQKKPYAHFLPSTAYGCAPLEVEFTHEPDILDDIQNLYWDLGDGTTATNVSEVTHTYSQPGEYYAQLIVETPEGCRDTSAGRWIYVGVPIEPVYSISDLDICLHESVEIELLNDDPRIDGWHVYTDDERTSHCFSESSLTHQFSTSPGVFDVEFSINYNGCFSETTVPEQITVNGANADISYMINCETPYDMMLKNDGLNADIVSWQIDNVEISNLDSLVHTFDDRGDYILTLITEDSGSGCPADTSSVEIFVREPVAAFEIPERICDNISYTYDATASVDVDTDCSQGYLWKLPNNRPREVSVGFIENLIPTPGPHDVTLIVEDMHGCRDTLTKSTEVYGIDGNMVADIYRTCLPDSITFVNLSTSDTTLVNTEWSFGGSDSIEVVYFENVNTNSIEITLELEDAIGCVETVTDVITIYEPTSNLLISQGPTICAGEEIDFSATDFTQENSFLNFSWDFGTLGSSDEQFVPITFDQPGTFPVELYFEEDASGCNGTLNTTIEVIPFPVADFVSSLDNVNPICYPAQIELSNTSTTSGQVVTNWYIDGQGPFTGDMTTFAFDKGTHEVELVVSSVFGCADTTSNSYTLVGPEGNFSIDPLEICVNDEITYTLFDTVDVTRWEWDFGDGNIMENGNPVTHIYEFIPNTGNTNVNLTLFSEETGCEQIQTIPVSIVGPMALFEKVDSLAYCNGIAFFNNLSTGANEYTWSTNGQVFSNDDSPRFDFGMSGDFEVTLIASVIGSVCSSEYTQEITLDSVPSFVELPNVFTPNGDGVNENFDVVVTDPQFEEFVNVITFKIYDRWGQLVYDNDNPPEGWDGTFNDTEAPNEVYAYYIEYEIINCKNEARKGNVTIIR